MVDRGVRGGIHRPVRLYLFWERWAKVVGDVLSSPALIRFGAVAFILAGTVGLAATALTIVAMFRAYSEYAPTAQALYEGSSLSALAFFLRGILEWLLVCAGLVGICGLLSDVRGRPLKLVLAGAAARSSASTTRSEVLQRTLNHETLCRSDGPDYRLGGKNRNQTNDLR